MKNSPRKPNESLFSRGGLTCTCFYGILIAVISLGAFLILPCALLEGDGEKVTLQGFISVLQDPGVLSRAQTYSFTVLGMSQLFHAIGMRDVQKSVFRMRVSDNKLMVVACILGFLLQFAVTEVPFLVNAFGTTSLSGREWLQLALMSAVPLAAHELIVLFGYGRERH